MAEKWETLVERGRSAIQRKDDSQWRIGDLAVKAVAVGPPGVNTKATERVKLYAEAIGAEFATVATYRKVAAAFPAVKRITAVSHGAHAAAMGSDKPVELLQCLLDEAEGDAGKVTVKAVKVAVKAEKLGTPDPVQEPSPSDHPFTDINNGQDDVKQRVKAVRQLAEEGRIWLLNEKQFAALKRNRDRIRKELDQLDALLTLEAAHGAYEKRKAEQDAAHSEDAATTSWSRTYPP